nr:ribonuclease J [uncultured Ilyobacter sp.]
MKKPRPEENAVAKTAGNSEVAKAKKEEKMYVIPLGGLDEIGKNMTLVQYRDEIIILDAGLTFPDDELLGIDLVIPDFSYIESNKNKIKGLFITHGHEDHIGGIPYLYNKIDKSVPMYGGKLTLALAKSKFDNPGFSKVLPKMKEIKGRSKIKVGKYFTVEFIKVTHSIADAYALAVTTPAGVIVHTGDFKIDLTPVDGVGVDFSRLAQLGDQGVDLLLSDSTNSEVEGFTPSEKSVGEAFRQEFEKAKGRIIAASFASHIHRLQQIIDVAHQFKRKIAIDGRSMVRVFEIASKLGYLKIPEGLMVSLHEVGKLKEDKVVILCTGTQGEPLAALSRIAKDMHKHIKLRKGDTVIISATPIPGNERAVYNNINNLLKHDAEVVFRKIAGIHVSGHASKDEQKLMLNLIKPKNFMPVHGEYKMLKAHKQTAIETGVDENQILIAVNGSKIEVTKSYAKIAGKVSAGAILVDGLGVGDIGNIVLRDRQQLGQDGVVIVVLTISKETGMILAGPDIVTRGFVYSRESEKMINEAALCIKEKLKSYEEKKITEWAALKTVTKDVASKYFYDKIQRNPVILPIIMEV